MSANYLKQLSIRLSVVFSVLCASSTFAQKNFDRYTTLLSEGPVPADFITPAAEKIKDDLATRETDLTPTNQRIFLEGIHRNIEPVLHSGMVIYGDEITTYVTAVAHHLLRDEPELRNNLRFYTIKSNSANALSTDQGIIFVTTGLLSQLTSEAQLAYVLSHEIAHYTEKHVSEAFALYNSRIRTSERIATLSSHSRENELEADKLALKLYHGAGYDDDEIVSTFDVLMYSYLPFDEVKLPSSYFSSEQMYIPDHHFATREYPIKTDEDYDDERSSHPNIRKRKETVIGEMAHYSNWGAVVYAQGESRFLYIRNLARFESVRTYVLDGLYAQALYAVFLLEKEFPRSVYLQQMKGRAWLGLVQLKEAGKLGNSMPSQSEYEGESAALYFFLRKLNTDGMLSVAMRTIHDTRKQFPEDTVLSLIEDRLIRTLAKRQNFRWTDYSSLNFREASLQALAKDTLSATSEETSDAPKSKYDKIRSKKNVNAPESFDSLKFYAYGIPDIVADSAYRKKYEQYRAIAKAHEQQKEQAIPGKKQKKQTDYTLVPNLDLERVVVVEPTASCVNKKGKPLWTMKDRSELWLQQALDASATKEGIEQVKVGRNAFAVDANTYNQRNTLYSLIEEAAVNPGSELVPVDYELLSEIEKATGASNVLYTVGNYSYDSQVNAMVLFVGTICYPLIPLTYLLYLPLALERSHQLETNILVMDLTTGEVRTAIYNLQHGRPKLTRYTKVFRPTMVRLGAPQ